MVFPPPPTLAFLALMFRSIDQDEFEQLIKLWEKEHDSFKDTEKA